MVLCPLNWKILQKSLFKNNKTFFYSYFINDKNLTSKDITKEENYLILKYILLIISITFYFELNILYN